MAPVPSYPVVDPEADDNVIEEDLFVVEPAEEPTVEAVESAMMEAETLSAVAAEPPPAACAGPKKTLSVLQRCIALCMGAASSDQENFERASRRLSAVSHFALFLLVCVCVCVLCVCAKFMPCRQLHTAIVCCNKYKISFARLEFVINYVAMVFLLKNLFRNRKKKKNKQTKNIKMYYFVFFSSFVFALPC